MSAIFGLIIYSGGVFSQPGEGGEESFSYKWREVCSANSVWQSSASSSNWADVSEPTNEWTTIYSDPTSIKRC